MDDILQIFDWHLHWYCHFVEIDDDDDDDQTEDFKQ